MRYEGSLIIMITLLIRILSTIAVLAAVLLATADGCIITCNPDNPDSFSTVLPSTTQEKPLEQIQAHPFATGKKYSLTSKR